MSLHIPQIRSAFIILFAGLFLAFAGSCLQHRTNCLPNLLFNLGVGRQAERDLVKKTIKQYNSVTAGFYASGGYLGEFPLLPADNLIKRKHYQNIVQLNRDGVVLVFDQDKSVSQKIHFYNRNQACVLATEQWAMAFQDAQTREKLSKVKGTSLAVRYMMRREQGKWIVSDVEVFPGTEQLKIP